MNRGRAAQDMLAELQGIVGEAPWLGPGVTPPELPLIAGRYRVTYSDPGEEHGVDEKDGTPVLVRPAVSERVGGKFVEQEQLERTARIAASLGSPWVLPVLLTTPRVVYAKAPPAVRPDAPLALPDAVECLLQFCDVLARAHAAGLVGIGADLHDVRVHREEGEWRITVVLPHLPPRGRSSHADMPPWTLTPVKRDLWTAVSFFRDLLIGRLPAPHHYLGDPPPPLPPFGDDDAHAALWVLLSDKPAGPTAEEAVAAAKQVVPFAQRVAALKQALAAAKQAASAPKRAVPPVADAASLAACVLHLARDPADWQSRVATMPRVSSAVAAPRDWDRLIELGTAELATCRGGRRNNYVVYPLAAAYHQRGCAAYARGDLDTAMRDVEQALSIDRWARYLVTRGVLRAARGDHEGALADYEEAVALADAKEPPEGVDRFVWSPLDPREPARAHYARGVARYRKGDVAGAGEDLQAAVQIIDTLVRDLRELKAEPDASLATLESNVRRALATVQRARAST